MPLETILQALEAESARQVSEVEQTAQAEVARLRAQAQAAATAARQHHLLAIQAPLQAERARIINQARLEALRVVMGTRETLMASALEMAAQCLRTLSASSAYPALLRQLTQEAVARLGTPSQLRLRVRSCDVELMCGLVEAMGLVATVEGNLEHEASPATASAEGGQFNGPPSPWGCLGGVVVATPDERISLANTLAARLQRAASLYRSAIAALVCGNGPEG
jgi:vacuolar-type H+-ATPase subunit E/Vma4